MRQVLGPGALGRPGGVGWKGRWERGSGWWIHVTSWLIHFNEWQNPLQCCEVIKPPTNKNKWRKKKRKRNPCQLLRKRARKEDGSLGWAKRHWWCRKNRWEKNSHSFNLHHGLSWWLSSKQSACNAGEADSIPGSGRSPGDKNGNPLQNSCLGNPVTEESGGLQSTGPQKSRTWLGN